MKKDYLSILKKSSSGIFVVKIVGIGLAFLLQLYLARLLKVDEFGVYIYVLTWMNLLLLIVTHGWDTSTIRHVSEYNAKLKWAALKGFLLTSWLFTLASSVIVSFCILVIVYLFEGIIEYNAVMVFMFGCFLLPVNTLLQTTCAGIQGMGQVVRSQMPQNIFRPFLFGLTLLFFTLYQAEDLNSKDAMLINIFSGFVALVLSMLLFKSIIPSKVITVTPTYEVKTWFHTAIPLLLVSGFIMLMNRLDILMLGSMSGTSEAGIYSVASRISELATFGLVAVNGVMAPMIASMYSTNKYQELQKIVSQSVIGVSIVTLAICLVLVVIGGEVISLFGAGFEIGEASLYILLLGQFVNSLSGSSGFLMSMTGQQKMAAYILGSVAIINAILNYILIPLYGMEGAAYATAISMVLWNILMAIVVRERTGIYPTIFSFRRAFK